MVLDFRHTKRYSLFLIITAVVLLANYLLMNLAIYKPITVHMAMATFLDLTVCLPLAFYLIILRKRHSIIHLVPVVILGFWVAYLFIPYHIFEQFKPIMYLLYSVEAIFILLELFILLKAVQKFPHFLRTFNEYKVIYPQFLLALRKSMETVFSKRLTNILSTDISVYYFSLFSWRKREESVGNHIFTYHKNTGYLAFVIMLAHALVIEMIGVHFLIAQKSVLMAWIFTSLDLITALFLIADYRSAMMSPITITSNHLNIVIGIRRTIEIPLQDIKSIHKTVTAKEIRNREKDSFYATLPQLIEEEEPAFEIELQVPVQAVYMYGYRKYIQKIYITVDNNEAFYHYIKTEMHNFTK